MAEAAAGLMGPLALPFVGMGLEVAGAQAEGQAASQAANFNAQVAMNNASIARQQAAEDERRFRINASKQIGDIRASYGASGVTSEGSVADILQESASTAELDALSVRHQGEMKAWAYETEAKGQRFKAQTAEQAANFKTASAILKGATSMAKGVL